ncbi:hypothetical protein BT96DRAFT_941038 [Gymnopus androsaceus JB14]|uniref:Uncharacterized protein n=1 Tax=Gymnopus androsaceus JB14 TaxID=1447944 RepID=A0A6A4HFM3_9AGAR|nr:hypothetical protein BT96DRAFT_941038 [Gymnopus androsaceus JB14]
MLQILLTRDTCLPFQCRIPLVSDSSIWHELETGIKREQGNLGHVRDVLRSEGSEKKLTDHHFGLHLTVNLDWFRAFSGRAQSILMWVICGGVTPGPMEPTECYGTYGIKMEIFDESNEDLVTETVYADVNCTNCDTLVHDYDMLKQKFYSKDAPIHRQSTILKNHGVRFSAFDWILGWRLSRQTAQLGENQSLKKADEWRCLLIVTPVLLWIAWRDPNDTIPDTEPAVSPNECIKQNGVCIPVHLEDHLVIQIPENWPNRGSTTYALGSITMVGRKRPSGPLDR